MKTLTITEVAAAGLLAQATEARTWKLSWAARWKLALRPVEISSGYALSRKRVRQRMAEEMAQVGARIDASRGYRPPRRVVKSRSLPAAK